MTKNPDPDHALVVMVGMAGGGKSTEIQLRVAAGCYDADDVFELDAYRIKLTGRRGDQSRNAEAVAEWHSDIEKRLAAGKRAIADGTSLTPEYRQVLLDIAARYGATTVAVVVGTPKQVCIDQDARRDEPVGKDVINRMAVEFAKLPTGNIPGFDITVRTAPRFRVGPLYPGWDLEPWWR